MNYQLEELSLELSNKCLLRCIHCSSGSQPEAMKDELTQSDHFRLMRNAAEDLGATILSLSGGDPILIPDLPDYIDCAAALGYEKILLYTTGIWNVDIDFVDGKVYTTPKDNYELEQFGITSILSYPSLYRLTDMLQKGLVFIFSLHSHEAATNDYIMRMPGAYRMITESIRYLTGLGAHVQVHCVPMIPNYDHIPKLRDLCVEMGAETMSLLRFVPQTRGFANAVKLLPTIDMFDKFQKAIDKELTSPERKDLPCSVRIGCPADFRHASRGSSVHKNGGGKPKSCHAGIDLILVRPTGAVHPCAAWKSLPTDSNVRTKSLKEIWAGDATYHAIREYLEGGYKGLDGSCSACRFLDSCKGGCPAQRLHAFGRELDDLYYPESDPLCPSRLYR